MAREPEPGLLPQAPAWRGTEDELGEDDGERLVLGDLVNRVLDRGLVISGQVTISIADIDLVALDLRVLVASIQTAIDRAGLATGSSSNAAADADLSLLHPDPGER